MEPSQLPAALPEPWHGLTTDESSALTRELRSECGEDHVLAGRDFQSAARCTACDQVLFALDHEEWAVVHLSWPRHSPEPDPQWPAVHALGSWDEVFDAVTAHARGHGLL
jgi:hypothetical protein